MTRNPATIKNELSPKPVKSASVCIQHPGNACPNPWQPTHKMPKPNRGEVPRVINSVQLALRKLADNKKIGIKGREFPGKDKEAEEG